MIKGFKEFILRGNVIDLAVAVVIGAAFTALVNAVVASIVNPLIALVWQADENGKFGPTINGLYGPVTFPISDLINAIISFIAVAIVVYFVFVFPMNKFKERAEARKGINAEESPALPTEQELLVQIRDLLDKDALDKQTPAAKP